MDVAARRGSSVAVDGGLLCLEAMIGSESVAPVEPWLRLCRALAARVGSGAVTGN